MIKSIGILGGMGPEATARLFKDIVDFTIVNHDQEHIPIFIANIPTIPDRTQAILYGGMDPVPKMIEGVEFLNRAGSDYIVIACNTAHYFIDQVKAHTDVNIINMIEETVEFVVRNNLSFDKNNFYQPKKVGLLATTGTIKTGIYHDYFRSRDVEVITPSSDIQEEFVMEAIYGYKGIKAGYKALPKKLLTYAMKSLFSQGVDTIIAGCTEIPLVLRCDNDVLIDPAKIVAMSAVRYAMRERDAIEESNSLCEVRGVRR